MAIGRDYEHSGKYTPGGLAWTLGAATIGGGLVGGLYGVVDFINPFIYINALGTFFTGVVAGAAVNFGATMGKVRNAKVTAAAGLFGGMIALWVSWAAWMWTLSDWELPLTSLLGSPEQLWTMIQLVNAKGAWSLKGSTPTGMFLGAIWGCEALIVLGGAFFTGWACIDGEPFCEGCGVWADKEVTAELVPPESLDDLTQSLRKGDASVLASLHRSDPEAATRLSVKARACPDGKTCPHWVAIKVQVKSTNSKGEEETSETELLPMMEADEAMWVAVQTGGAPGAPPAATTAPEDVAPTA